MKSYQEPAGLTGRDIERLNEQIDGDLESIHDIVPADSQGNHLALGMSTMHTMSLLPPGILEPMPGGPEMRDPVVSEAQRRAMYAAAEGRSKIGIPAKVGKEFVAESHGVKHLPERKGKK